MPASDGAGVKLRRSLGRGDQLRARPVPDARRVLVREPGRLRRRLPGASAPRLRDRDLHARRPHAARGPPRQPRRPQERRRAVDDRRAAASSTPRCRSRSEGRMRGFQLWINLPAKEKMKPAGYRDIQPARSRSSRSPAAGASRSSPARSRWTGGRRRARSSGLHDGSALLRRRAARGRACSRSRCKSGHNAFVYAYEGSVSDRPDGERRALESAQRGRALGRATASR